MKLTITAEASHPVHAENMSPADQVAMMLAAIGFSRNATLHTGCVAETKPLPVPDVSGLSVSSAAPETSTTVLDEPSVQEHIAKRERGKPSAGRKRRTAEEVAEDEAAEKTAAETVEIVKEAAFEASGMDEETKALVDAEIAAEQSAISTGEARVGPDDESEEDQIQDIADEIAEVAATVEPGAPATLEDVRAALMDYGHAYGMPAVQSDGQAFMRSVLGAPPEGQPIWKMTMFPEDRYGEIVSAFKVATETNPHGRDRV